MRLNLNKTLRAALIAAVSVVGFTITQAQAVTLTEVISMESMASQATITAGTSVSSSWQIADGVVYDFDGTGYLGGIKDGDLLAALKGDQYVTVAAWINPSVRNVSGDGCAIFGYGAQGDGVKVIAHKNGSLKVTTKGVADFTNSATGIDLNNWELVAVTMHKNGNKLDIKYMLNGTCSDVVSGGAAKTATTDSFAIGSGNSEGVREQFKGSIGDLTVFTSSDWATYEDVSNIMSSAPTEIVAVDMTWNGAGSSDTWNTTDTNTNWIKDSNPAAYESGVATTAIFDTTASAKTVQLGAALKAKDVKVGAGYTFDMNGNTLTAKKLTVDGEGASLTLTGTGSLTVSEIAASGKTITISEGAVLQGTGTGTISGNGTYVLNGTSSLGNIVLGDGWTGTVSLTAVDANNLNFDNLTKGANSTLELRGYKGYSTNWYDNRTNVQNIRLVNDASRGYAWKMNAWGSSMTTVGIYSGTWTGDGTLTYETYSGNDAKNVNQKFTGDLSAWTGTLKLDKNGTLQLTVALSNPLWGAAIDRNQGVINMIVEKNAEFAQSVSVTSMDVNAGQTVTLKGASTIDTMKGAGALTIDAGANTVTLKGVEALAKSITLTSGTLSLNGTINISNDMPITGGGASYSGGQNQGNGFQTVEGLLQVVALNGGTLTEGTVSYTYGGKEIATKLTDGAINVAPTTSYSIFYTKVANTTESMEAAQAVAEEHQDSINSVVMSNSTTLAADIARSYALTLEDGASATVNATAATTISSLSGTGSTLYITGDSVVTLASSSSMTSTIDIGGTATVKLDNGQALGAAANSITVHTGATLDINGKDAPASMLYTVTLAGGTYANTGNEVSYGSRQLVKALVVTDDSLVNAESHDFGLINGGYAATTLTLDATLEKVGSHDFHVTNATVTGDGAIKVTEGAVWFGRADGAAIGSYASDFIMNGGNVKGRLALASNISVTTEAEGGTFSANVTNNGYIITFDGDYDLTASGVISGEGGIIKDGEGTLTLHGTQTYTGTTVVKGGKLVVEGALADDSAISVEGDATIDGNVDTTQVGIAADTTATFEQGISDASGVMFSKEGGVEVKNTNAEGPAIKYSIDEENAKVTADKLVFFSAEGDAEVKNLVAVGSVQNLYSEGALTLTNVDTSALHEVVALMGDVVLENVASVDLQQLTISSATVAVYTDATAEVEGTVTITEALTSGGGTLLANLTVKGGSMLDMVDIDNKLATVTLGSELSFAEDGLVSLSDDVIALLNGMEVDGYWDIFQTYGGRELEFLSDYEGAWFDSLFNRNGELVNVEGDFQIEATPDHFRLVKNSMVPEPTTGTLSLLALMALAARRRRK